MDSRAFFIKKTNININYFLIYYNYFIEEHYPKIVSFYTQGSDLDKSFFNVLDTLIDLNSNIQLAIDNYSEELSSGNIGIWELIDICSDIDIAISTIQNSSKWFRSSMNMYGENNFKKQVVLKRNQTFEELYEEEGNENEDSDWYKIKNYNGLTEEDYDKSGGNILTMFKTNPVSSFSITVGDTTGVKIYGTDISKVFEYDEETQDLVILTETETFNEHLETMVGMVRGSVPEFKNKGIDKSLLINENLFDFPAVFRQQNQVLLSDERIAKVELTDIVSGSDSKGLKLNIYSILGDSINKDI